MLAPRGVAVCGLAIVAWALGRFLGVDELYVVSGAAVAIVALAVVSTRLSSTRIAVRRGAHTHHAHAGEHVPVELALRNDGRLPASLLLVEDRRPVGIAAEGDDDEHGARFVVHGLRPRQMVTLQWHAIGRRRGRYTIGPVRIRLRDPFGLAERSRRYRATDDLVVFPIIERLPAVGGRGIRHGADARAAQRAFQRGDEFYTMRAYVVGDDLRHVHWPSTAHRGELMVRQHELPWQARAVVYVDCRAHLHRGTADRSTFERAVSAAASVLVHLHDQRYEVHLVTDGRAAPEPAGGVDAALVRLAEVAPTTERSPVPALRAAEHTGDGLLVTVLRPPGDDDTELVDHPEVRALQQAGRAYRTRVALVLQHHDAQRCDTLAGLLRIAGWQAVVVTDAATLGDAWRQAMAGVGVGRLTGVRT